MLQLGAGNDKAAFKSGLMTTLVAQPRNLVNSSTTIEASPTSEVPIDVTTNSLANRERTVTDSHASPHPASPAPPSEEHPNESSHRDAPNVPHSSVAREDTRTGMEPSANSQQSAVQRLLQDRRERLEKDKEKKQLEEVAERKAKAEAQKKAIQAAPDSAKAKQATFAQEQRKRNLEAKSERERVLRQIEQDKIERKERNERHKELLKADALEGLSKDSNAPRLQAKGNENAQTKSHGECESRASKSCAVQVRLFDGGTIRSKFAVDQTLTDVREWVDKEKLDDVPFTFKQILTPLPNRSFMISEERERLVHLGLVPNATLVMVPVRGYTAAYTDSPQSVISRVSTLPANVVTAGVGLVSGALGSILGFGQAGPSGEDPHAQAPSPSQSEQQPDSSELGSHVRTLGGWRDGRDEFQLYNGNQVRRLALVYYTTSYTVLIWVPT